jgi:DNA helicase INO80
MSLSSIMDSGADPDPPAKPQQLLPINDTRAFSKPSPNPLFVKQEAAPSPAPADLPYQDSRAVPYESMPPVGSAPPASRLVPRELPAPEDAAVEAALAHIETHEMKDVDTSSMEVHLEKEEYELQTRKHALDLEATENSKRKV